MNVCSILNCLSLEIMLYTAIKLKYMYYPGMCNMSTKTFLLVKSEVFRFYSAKNLMNLFFNVLF